jgi:hypothetical protein
MGPDNHDHELTAFSVQDLGSAWRWRIYRAGGTVALQGISLTQKGAEHAALEAFAQAHLRQVS